MSECPTNASEVGRKAFRVLDSVYRGIYHLPYSLVRRIDFTDAICVEVCVPGSMSTYDFDELTRLVIAAHEERVRVTIGPASPKYIRLMFHNRTKSYHDLSARMWERHPTIEEAVSIYRGRGKRGEPEVTEPVDTTKVAELIEMGFGGQS